MGKQYKNRDAEYNKQSMDEGKNARRYEHISYLP